MKKPQILKPTQTDGIPEIAPEALISCLDQVTLIDVRRPEEFSGELSHICGARLITLGPELDAFLNSHDLEDEIVFICRSGARSGRATLQAQSLGFYKCTNLQGGMLLWNTRQYPIEKNT